MTVSSQTHLLNIKARLNPVPLGLLCLPPRSSLLQHALNEPTFHRDFHVWGYFKRSSCIQMILKLHWKDMRGCFFVQQREASAQQCRLPPSVPAAEVTDDQTSQTYTHLYSFFTWKEPNHTHRDQVGKQTATFFKRWPFEQFSFTLRRNNPDLDYTQANKHQIYLICTTATMLGQLYRESTHRITSFKAAALSQGLRNKKKIQTKNVDSQGRREVWQSDVSAASSWHWLCNSKCKWSIHVDAECLSARSDLHSHWAKSDGTVNELHLLDVILEWQPAVVTLDCWQVQWATGWWNKRHLCHACVLKASWVQIKQINPSLVFWTSLSRVGVPFEREKPHKTLKRKMISTARQPSYYLPRQVIVWPKKDFRKIRSSRHQGGIFESCLIRPKWTEKDH